MPIFFGGRIVVFVIMILPNEIEWRNQSIYWVSDHDYINLWVLENTPLFLSCILRVLTERLQCSNLQRPVGQMTWPPLELTSCFRWTWLRGNSSAAIRARIDRFSSESSSSSSWLQRTPFNKSRNTKSKLLQAKRRAWFSTMASQVHLHAVAGN